MRRHPQRTFRSLVLLTAMSGHLAYALAAEKPGLALLGLLVACVSIWQTSRTLAGNGRPAPRALLNSMVIAAIVLLVLQLIGRTQEVITSLTDFLCYVMLVKCMDRVKMRDEAQLLCLSLFVVIGALLTGQSLGLGLALVVYTPMAIASSVALQMHTARERQLDLYRAVGLAEPAQVYDSQLSAERAGAAVARVAALCVVGSMAAGVCAFVVTPRQLAQQLGLAAAPFIKTPTTGFTDEIQLGSAGLISESEEPVMDVRIVSGASSLAPGSPIYLRGAVLDRYNKERKIWYGLATDERLSDSGSAPIFDQASRSLFEVRGSQNARVRTQYEIVVRNTRANNETPLHVPLHPIAVSTTTPTPIRYRSADAIVKASPPGGRFIFNVTSAADFRAPAGDATPPPEIFSQPVKELADRLLREREVNLQRLSTDPFEVRKAVQAVIAHLATFGYTLEMVAPPQGQDPVEMFLFDRKLGHCEYFATAMVALLRSAGVPSRVVTGYAASELNTVSGYYTVRQSDAHAWVEVMMEPGRWETFDPTPPGGLQATRRAGSGPLAWIKQVWEAIEFSWLDNVVAYDRGLRVDLAALGSRGDPGAAAVRWQEWSRDARRWIQRHLPQGTLGRAAIVGVATFGVVLAIYALARGGFRIAAPLRRWLQSLAGRRSRRASFGLAIPTDAQFYRVALDALDSVGRSKPQSVPPLMFCASLRASGDSSLATSMERLTKLFYRSRFGGKPLSSQEQNEGMQAANELARKLRESENPPQTGRPT